MYIIDPGAPRKIAWDILIGILILFSILTIPYVIAFKMNYSIVLECVIDSLFFLDIIATFNTAYEEKNTGLMVKNRKLIFMRYLEFWFWIDILSTIPFDIIIQAILSSVSSSLVTVTKVTRAFRLLRLVKLIRIFRLFRLMRNMETSGIHLSYIDSQYLILKVLFVCHFVACFWIATVTLGTGQSKNTWISNFGFDGAPKMDTYIASIYWSITTLFSIGYGDISATNTNERIYSMVIEILGGIVFGAVIAQVAQIKDNHDPVAKAMAEKMSELTYYLEEKELPVSVKRAAKVRHPETSLFKF